MDKSNQLYKVLRLVADYKDNDMGFKKDPDFLSTWEELARRELLNVDLLHNMKGTYRITSCEITAQGYEYLDAVEKEAKENAPITKVKKAVFGTIGKVAIYVLCFCAGALALAYLNKFLGLN